jgi:hypothetical protein
VAGVVGSIFGMLVRWSFSHAVHDYNSTTLVTVDFSATLEYISLGSRSFAPLRYVVIPMTFVNGGAR